MNTYYLGVNRVAVVTIVYLVMKSMQIFVTPGKLTVGVPLDPDWMCDCPGVYDFRIGSDLLITGIVEKKPVIQPGYIMKVYHGSLVKSWNEKILDDMVKNKAEYNGLKFLPSLSLYKILFG